MERKIGIAFVLLGLAALSPAPINRAKGPRTFHPEMTQEQVAKQQAFNGVQPIVGQVPRVVDESGLETSPKHGIDRDRSGENSIAMGTANADKVGGVVTKASERVESEEKAGKLAWFWGVLIAALGFGGWKFFQYKIEKGVPVPEFSKRFLKEMENSK